MPLFTIVLGFRILKGLLGCLSTFPSNAAPHTPISADWAKCPESLAVSPGGAIWRIVISENAISGKFLLLPGDGRFSWFSDDLEANNTGTEIAFCLVCPFGDIGYWEGPQAL